MQLKSKTLTKDSSYGLITVGCESMAKVKGFSTYVS